MKIDWHPRRSEDCAKAGNGFSYTPLTDLDSNAEGVSFIFITSRPTFQIYGKHEQPLCGH